MNTTPSLPRETQTFPLARAGLSLAPFVAHVPWSIAVLAGLLTLWAGWLTHTSAPPPHRGLLILIGLLGCAICFAEYRSLFGREAGLSLLSLFLPLKLLEGQSSRDARAALLLCCFLLTGQFLNEQSLFVAASVLACAVSILACSAKLERPALQLRPALRGSLRLLAAATPLMLLLFVLFPRIDGPLWRLPGDAYSGQSGLSDSMQPGSISQLIQSGEIAFRADFADELPPPRERYWRGPVLSEFDGSRWRERPASTAESPAYLPQGKGYRYTLTLEANNRPWLLALDFPAAGATEALYASDLKLLGRKALTQRRRIALQSFPASTVGLTENPRRLERNLQLPPNSNPRTQSAGQKIGAQFSDPGARVDAAIKLMREAGLAYTLNPPLTGQHAADEFLFDSKRGFCEHFSSTFVILMRAAGVPARVVTGYQGGERNPVDGSLVVRQSDAHAWAEVWLESKGWLRVDPTASSAPRRIDDGIAQALPAGDALPMLLRTNSTLLRLLRHRWEAISNGWNQWVLGYNASRQLELMRKLGLPDADWRQLTLMLAGFTSVWLLWLFWRLWPRHARLNPLDRLWQKACNKLARRGLKRRAWESAADFAQRACLAHPLHADTIHEIAERYSSLRFGKRPPTAAELAALRQIVKHFKP